MIKNKRLFIILAIILLLLITVYLYKNKRENMDNKHYRAVILILASNNNDIYKNCRNIWKQYMNTDPTIKVFFVYGKLTDKLTDYDPKCDLIYNDIMDESQPINMEKSIKAMESIDSLYTYDFFIRTNLSTFWDFDKLQLHLNELPTSNCYSGYSHTTFVSGTDIIVTPDIIKNIVQNEKKIKYDIVDDVALGLYLNLKLKIPIIETNEKMCWIEDITDVKKQDKQLTKRINDAILDNKSHYRVKNKKNVRESVDLYVYTKLLKMIYDIDYL
jgi:hypothetical protein